MEKIFKKHEFFICMLLIVLYIVTNSFCLQNFGEFSYKTTIVNTILSALLVGLILSIKRVKHYGLAKVENPKKYLYFLPLILIVSVNLWNGININNSPSEIIFYILTMINVGFIEEIIFRGFLFKMMEESNVKSAIVVSAITFGIGHIVNLLNGAAIVPTLIQICYAISIGFLFAIIFYKSKSIVPCIIAHSTINALSVFNGENENLLYVTGAFLTIVPIIYAIYIMKTVKDREDSK